MIPPIDRQPASLLIGETWNFLCNQHLTDEHTILQLLPHPEQFVETVRNQGSSMQWNGISHIGVSTSMPGGTAMWSDDTTLATTGHWVLTETAYWAQAHSRTQQPGFGLKSLEDATQSLLACLRWKENYSSICLSVDSSLEPIADLFALCASISAKSDSANASDFVCKSTKCLRLASIPAEKTAMLSSSVKRA